ncbi:MAG: HrpF/NolX family T3SS translocon protein [Pseudomonadota bacterium]
MISIAELKAAARGDFPRVRFGQIQATPEAMDRAQKAAQYFLAHPDKLKAVDVALGVNTGHKKNSTVDGLIARDDIATRMNKMPLSQAEVAVVRVLQKSKGEDGAPLTFTIKTLEALAANPKATAAEREAARYVLDNPAFMVRLDTANQVARGRGTDGFGDGKITDSDLKTLLNRPEAKKSVRQDTPAQIAEQKTALSNLGQSFDLISGGKNLISKADLQAAARGIFPSAAFGEIDASAEAKRKAQSAAQYFLTHSNKLNAVDTGLGKNIGDSRINKVDGLISRDDIATRMNKMPLSTTEIGVVRTLQESKGAGGKPFSFNEQSLTVMANDPKATLKQRQAAQYVLDNPAFRVRLDTASQVATRHGTGGFGDGKIVESDFNALLNRPEARALA